MKLYILNDKDIVVKIIDGQYDTEKKVFTYKEGGFLGFGAVDKSIPIDIANCIYTGKEYIAFYKNNAQVKLKDTNNLQLNEYANYLKMLYLTEATMLPKPKGLEEFLPFLSIIALIVIFAISYMALNNLTQTYQNNILLLNKTINSFYYNQNILLNLTKENNELFKRLIGKV